MAKMKELKKLTLNKIAEINISEWGISVAGTDMDTMLRNMIGCRNMKDGNEIKFNGKLTIIIEELPESQSECNFFVEREEEKETI